MEQRGLSSPRLGEDPEALRARTEDEEYGLDDYEDQTPESPESPESPDENGVVVEVADGPNGAENGGHKGAENGGHNGLLPLWAADQRAHFDLLSPPSGSGSALQTRSLHHNGVENGGYEEKKGRGSVTFADV